MSTKMSYSVLTRAAAVALVGLWAALASAAPQFNGYTGFDFGFQTPISINGPTAWTPSGFPADGSGGAYTQYLIYNARDNGTGSLIDTGSGGFAPGVSGSSFKFITADSTWNASTAFAGEVFRIVRTDGASWNGLAAPDYTALNGTLVHPEYITLAKFENLPTLPAAFVWQVSATDRHIDLYIDNATGPQVGDTMPDGGGAVPLPAPVWAGSMLLGGLSVARFFVRRRATA